MPALSATEGTDLGGGMIVGPKCDDTTATGHWMCLTHVTSFPNNFSMHSHTDEGDHVVTWVCHAHGPEVP